MSSKPTQIKDAAAKKATADAFSRAGWKIHFATTDDASQNGNCIYLCDIDTGYLVVVSVTKPSLSSLKQQTASAPFGFDDICNALGTLLAELAAGRQRFDHHAQQSLGVAASLYMMGTRTYELALSQAQSECQFLVVRYLDISAGEHVLRPAALPTNRRFSPGDVEGLVERIITMDRQQHPERFPRAAIIPFKAKTIQRIE